MPIHGWTRVSAGTFHAFHNAWITHVQEAEPVELRHAGQQWMMV